MKYPGWSLIVIAICCILPLATAQDIDGGGVTPGQAWQSYYDSQTGAFIQYCHYELFPKFEKRRYGLTPLYGQAFSFELWADSINRRYLISVDVAEQGWAINTKRSIPIIFRQYTDDYNIEAFVEIYYRGMAKPIFSKKYQVVINGKNSYQLMKNDPDWNKLYVPYKKRQIVEKQALKTLAAKVSSDLYSVIN
jgi:hypothetical protein